MKIAPDGSHVDDVFATLDAVGALLARSSRLPCAKGSRAVAGTGDGSGVLELAPADPGVHTPDLAGLVGVECDATWARIVAYARSGEPAWRVGAAWLALPALSRVADRLSRETGTLGNVESARVAVLAGFVAAVDELDYDGPALFDRLIRAAYRAGEIHAVRAPCSGPGSASSHFGSIPAEECTDTRTLGSAR